MGQSSIVSTDTQIELNITSNGAAYVDLAQCLSIINRRSYRQGMNYAIGSIEMIAGQSGTVNISTVPTTWVADNATTKAFEAWKDQRAEVLKEQPSLKAKWSDFKVFMDETHAQAGTAANLTPVDALSAPYLLGTWDTSEYVCPLPGAAQAAAGDAQEVRFHVCGDHTPPGPFSPLTTNVGLIQAYADSRAKVLFPDPAVPTEFDTGFYNVNSLPDEMQVDVMDNVANRNDDPPYNVAEYPGGRTNAPTPQFRDAMVIRNWGDATTFSSDTAGPFVAPLGLLRFLTSGFDGLFAITVIINLVPGKYKGVLAERGL